MTGALDRAGEGACGQRQTGAQVWKHAHHFQRKRKPPADGLLLSFSPHRWLLPSGPTNGDAVGRCPLQPLESLQNGALLGLAIEEGMQILHLMTRTNHSTTSKERRRGQTNASNSWCPALLFCSAPIPSLPTDLVARLPLPTTCLWLFNRDFRPVCRLVLFRRALAVHGRRGHGQKERGDGTNDK